MKIKEKLMKTNENPGKIMKKHWKLTKTKETWVNDKENQRKTKEIVEKQMKTNEKHEHQRKHQKNQWKPMNKNNDKERTTHENYWEPKKNLGTHQGKTNREPQKNQWKTKEGTMKNNGKPKTILPAF